MAGEPQMTASPQFAAAHRDLAPEDKAFGRWSNEQHPYPL